MTFAYYLIAIALVVIAVLEYKKYKRHCDENVSYVDVTTMVSPFPKNAGPAFHKDGSINWESDEMLSGEALKHVAEVALAPYIASDWERAKYRCPWCGSDDWGSVPDIIFCSKGCGKGSDDAEYRAEVTAVNGRISTITEWRNLDHPYWQMLYTQHEKKIRIKQSDSSFRPEWTGSLFINWLWSKPTQAQI